MAPTDGADRPAPGPKGGGPARDLEALRADLAGVALDVVDTLNGVNSPETAGAASPRLAELTAQVERLMGEATARFLLMSDAERGRVMERAAKDPSEADQRLAKEGGISGAMIRAAGGPGGPRIVAELQKLRDVILRAKAPFSPVLVRKHLAEKFGAEGTPFRTPG